MKLTNELEKTQYIVGATIATGSQAEKGTSILPTGELGQGANQTAKARPSSLDSFIIWVPTSLYATALPSTISLLSAIQSSLTRLGSNPGFFGSSHSILTGRRAFSISRVIK